ncbi:aprataxin [Anopheles ziemanni]|uniref:aprataxin n=1 Tax=Anopheles coustani TaxID=139045 RepID=UPI00265AD75E|nr:aprataxin [Anopheles coustani]XP_058172833.1 aprataxin [Anopheles ziemanni]
MASYSWSDALIFAINNVAKQVFVSELAVVIKDKYPKAIYHFLVLPWKDIDSVYELSSGDEGLLHEMYNLGLKATDSSGLPVGRFEFGYHMKPSMRRLHLHVISKDYHSPCLSHRFHWTAFNTDFFMKHEYVIEKIRAEGHIQRPNEKCILELLESPLQCNQCSYQPISFQELKRHLKQHVEE